MTRDLDRIFVFFLNKRGSMMIMTLVFMIVMAALVSVTLNALMFSRNAADKWRDGEKAFCLAEAGIDKAIWYLLHTAPSCGAGCGTSQGTTDGSWRVGPLGLTESFEGVSANGTYRIRVLTRGSDILIRSTGSYQASADAPLVERDVERKITLTPSDKVTFVADTWTSL